MCAYGGVAESPTFLISVEVVVFKYGSHLHFSKSSAGRDKETDMQMLTRRVWAKGVWHICEWSIEIYFVVLQDHDLLLQF